MLLLLSCLVVAPAGRAPSAEDCVRLENAALAVDIARRDGAILSVFNKRAGLDLISLLSEGRRPWLMLLDGGEFVDRYSTFSMESRGEHGEQTAELRWAAGDGITVCATLSLGDNADELLIRSEARNQGNRTIIALNYPRLQGIGPLGDSGGVDYFLHSALGGALVRDPFTLFSASATIPQGRGFLPCRYPNGFGGSPMQMMAYYREGVGGFYLAAEDFRLTDKDLNFYKTGGNGALAWEIAHFQWDARPGVGLTLDYPVTIAALTEGTWYEAAERYRAWATHQPWCARGTRLERVKRGDASRWLLEKTGAVTMWTPFELDMRETMRRTREAFGAPLLHLPLRWTHAPSVDDVRAAGDHLGPFYFPFVALEGGPTHQECAADQLVPRTSAVVPKWVAMCPAEPGWRRVAVESAEDLAGSGRLRHHNVWIDANPAGCSADTLYSDIGPCAGVPTHCLSTEHHHAPGTGRGITEAYISLIEEMQSAASLARGAYVPVGTECVGEPYVACLDTSYVRSCGLDLAMETMPYTRFLTWIPDGQMEIVPLFEFVYHEYGPVAMQGIYSVYPWSASRGDDLWTWSEARATLWGQLVVTHPLYPGAEVSPERRAFLHGMTAARTGFANDFLAYGRLQRPPPIGAGSLAIDHGLGKDGWLRALAFPEHPEGAGARDDALPDHGDWSVEEWIRTMRRIPSSPARTSTMTVPEVLAQAYTLGNRLGVLMVNLHRETAVRVPVTLDLRAYGLPPGRYTVEKVTATGRKPVRQITGAAVLAVDLPPREFVLLDVRPRR
jgi:hypothetical protein